MKLLSTTKKVTVMAYYASYSITLIHLCTIFAAASLGNGLTRPKFSSILVFGDSTVDTGNNNYIETLAKGNHFPYGKDFPGHVPTGRFSNGKLVPDFIASMLNLKDTVPPFLQPNLSDEDLLTGVSFASGGSGFDDFTTALTAAIAMSQQIEYFKVYAARLKGIAGEHEAKQILRDSLVIISAGTNDFLLNFYDISTRKLEFNIDEYQDFVLNRLQIFIKELYDLGCRKFAVSGLPCIGCIPIQITKSLSLKDRKCVEDENSDAKQYNRKLARLLLKIEAMLPQSKVVYADIYDTLINLINHPQKYGLKETNKGCCGSGLFEVSPLCNELSSTCDDPSKYVFWDSVHPTEVVYKYIAKYIKMEVLPKFQFDWDI
ncbi:GDSL esterase/lipase At2g30220-like [Phaseolus vulgaris]